MNGDPLTRPKADLQDVVERISLPDSPVGIDAQYTHAIIIAYLQQIAQRLDRLEAALAKSGLAEPPPAGA